MKKILSAITIALLVFGLGAAISYYSETSAAAERLRRETENRKLQAQCVAAKASTSAKEVIATAFWGLREVDADGNIKDGPDLLVEARALQAINTLASLCLQEITHSDVTVTHSFQSAWRLAELMKIDDEFSEAVGKAKESQQKQYEEYNAKQLERKAAEKAKSSWAVK